MAKLEECPTIVRQERDEACGQLIGEVDLKQATEEMACLLSKEVRNLKDEIRALHGEVDRL